MATVMTDVEYSPVRTTSNERNDRILATSSLLKQRKSDRRSALSATILHERQISATWRHPIKAPLDVSMKCSTHEPNKPQTETKRNLEPPHAQMMNCEMNNLCAMRSCVE
ncbi:hypothetical protein R1flu_017374 [Riccia fluitans]|uniref:Uncharacterized protein n=1 Tax=Riccia fluitans TaxID=41844 RepID=A0ABD1ZCS8_9MARC